MFENILAVLKLLGFSLLLGIVIFWALVRRPKK